MALISNPADSSKDIFGPRFERAFDAHHADVLAFAIRRVDTRAAAEDVVAETFAVVWRRRDAIPDEPLPWLYGVARHVIANQRRSERRRGRLRERLSAELARGEEARDPAQLVTSRDEVIGALAHLSESEREVLMLVAWEDLDAGQAARVLDCTPAAFRVRLHRARRELRRHLESADLPGEGEANAGASAPAEEAT